MKKDIVKDVLYNTVLLGLIVKSWWLK
jgi:hypothetical protein